jgi:hypothetical protein
MTFITQGFRERDKIDTPLTHKYMTVHFSGLVQTLKWGVQLVLEVQSPPRVTNKFISCDNNMRASSSSLWYKMDHLCALC